MLLFISTFCKINFGSINLITELGQQATLLMVEREIRKHRLRALWILQNNVIKGENLWVRNLFSFYNFQCPSEGINSELTINIVLGRNHLTKYVCCSTWPARTHVIPQNKNTLLWKTTGNSACSTLSVDSLEHFSFSTIWQPSSLSSDTNWGKKTFM